QLQSRVSQDRRHPKSTQAWSQTADDHLTIAAVVPQDETGDHDVVTGADKGTRAEVSQLRRRALGDVVHLKESYAGAVVLTPDNTGVASRGQGRVNRRFEIIGRREASGLNCCLLGISPVVIGHGHKTRRTV